MKKSNKLLILALVLSMMISLIGVFAVSAAAEDVTYSYTFSAKQFTANGTKTLGGVNWTLAGNGNYWGYDGTKGQQFGSSGAPYKSLTLTSANFSNVTKIVINTSGASSVNASFVVTVDGQQVGSSTKLTSSATSYTFEPTTPLSGPVVFTYTQSSSKAIYIKSISVTTSAGSSSEPACEHDNKTTTTIDPTCTQKGSETVTCDDCGEILEYKELSVLDHTPGEDATCISSQICTVCNNVIVPATGVHTYNSSGVCSVCGDVRPSAGEMITISKTHTDIADIAGVTPGQNTGVIADKEIIFDTYISIVCSKGTASTDPTIYSESIRLYQNGAVLTVKVKEGAKISSIVLTLANNTAGQGPISVTGGTASELTDATYTITVNEGVDEVVITTTGTDKNNRVYVSNVSVTYSIIGSLDCDHSTTVTETIAPTCTEKGKIVVKCANADCGHVISETEDAPALGHVDNTGDYKCDRCTELVLPEADSVLTIDQALAIGVLTKTTDKYYLVGTITGFYGDSALTYGNVYITDENDKTILIYGLYSKDGSTRYDAMEVKPVIGDVIKVYGILTSFNGTAQMSSGWMTEHTHTHSYESEVTTPAGCESTGTTTYTCSTCGDVYTEEIAALGHNEDIVVPGKTATCIETGLTEGKKCSVCGVVTVEQNEISLADHHEVNGSCKWCDLLMTPWINFTSQSLKEQDGQILLSFTGTTNDKGLRLFVGTDSTNPIYFHNAEVADDGSFTLTVDLARFKIVDALHNVIFFHSNGAQSLVTYSQVGVNVDDVFTTTGSKVTVKTWGSDGILSLYFESNLVATNVKFENGKFVYSGRIPYADSVTAYLYASEDSSNEYSAVADLAEDGSFTVEFELDQLKANPGAWYFLKISIDGGNEVEIDNHNNFDLNETYTYGGRCYKWASWEGQADKIAICYSAALTDVAVKFEDGNLVFSGKIRDASLVAYLYEENKEKNSNYNVTAAPAADGSFTVKIGLSQLKGDAREWYFLMVSINGGDKVKIKNDGYYDINETYVHGGRIYKWASWEGVSSEISILYDRSPTLTANEVKFEDGKLVFSGTTQRTATLTAYLYNTDEGIKDYKADAVIADDGSFTVEIALDQLTMKAGNWYYLMVSLNGGGLTKVVYNSYDSAERYLYGNRIYKWEYYKGIAVNYSAHVCSDADNNHYCDTSACGKELSVCTPADAVEENRIESTCTVAGSYDSVVKCSVCGEEIRRTKVDLPLADHTPADAVEENRTESSCTVAGSYESVVKCSVCGEELSRAKVDLPLADHTPADAVEENRTESTCTVAGSYESVVYCSVCKTHVISRDEVDLPLASHTYENGACKVCGAKQQFIIVSDATIGNIGEEHKDIILQIQTSGALANFAPTNVPDGAQLVIELVGMNVVDGVPGNIVFNVAPMMGEEKVQPTEAITFRLPVPSNVTKAFAKVYHESDLMGIYAVKGEGNARYVEVSSKTFSAYSVEPVDAVAKIGEVNYATLLDALLAAAESDSASEIKLLQSVREKMPTDIELIVNADLLITADSAVTAQFYNEGTNYDFIFNSNNNNTITIGENVTFQLEDRVIWLGYYGNDVDVVVDGTLAGYQIWHGADTTVSATGTLKTTGEALVLRRGATLTVEGGKIEANYFSILSGHIFAEDATIDCGAFWIANTGSYPNESNVSISIWNSTMTSSGNLKSASDHSAGVSIDVYDSVVSFADFDGYGASQISDNTTLMVNGENAALTIKSLTNNGVIDVYDSASFTVTGAATNNGTITLEAGSSIEGPENMGVITDSDGYEIVYENGKYTAKTIDYVAAINGVNYVTLAEALAAAKDMSGDVTVEILGKATLNSAISGSFDSITFVGKDTDAEIYLDVQGYITATGKTVNFEDLTLSKAAGGFITNAGFMNVAFGVYDVNAVNYTNCVFANGSYASSGKVTYTDCTFYRSHDKYGLWAYGDADIIVDGCIFDDYRGIKMYAEGAAKTTNLTVKNSDFSKLDNKPAIVLTYGESVTLEGNTYSGTGVFELDLDGAPNGTVVNVPDDITCKNDNGACGVIVDGKIYTTVEDAAAVATSGSTVTLLHNSSETVELAEGVNLDKNGYTADGVTVKVFVASGNIQVGYITTNYNNSGRHGLFGEATNVVARDSFVVYIYSGDTLIGTSALNDPEKILLNGESKSISWHILIGEDTDSWWNTSWEGGALSVDTIPDRVELYVDGAKVSEGAVKLHSADNSYPIIGIVSDADGNVKSFVAADGYTDNVQNAGGKLGSAIAAAEAGDVITLIADVTVTEKINLTGVSLDLNSHTLYLKTTGNYVVDTVTISNGTIDLSGNSVNGNTFFTVGGQWAKAGSVLNLNDVDLIGDGYHTDWAVICVHNGTSLNMDGCTVDLKNDNGTAGGFIKDTSGNSNTADIVISNSTITLENVDRGFTGAKVTLDNVDLTITGGEHGINGSELLIKDSTVSISDGTGRGITLNKYDSSIVNSEVTLSNMGEGGIRFKTANALTVDADSTLAATSAHADVAGATINGYAVTGTEEKMSNVTVDGGTTTVVNPSYPVGIGTTFYETLAEALAEAKDGDVITLYWAEGDDPIAMNGAVFGKTVTITGTALVDWDKGFLFIGRGGAGDGTVIFENAKLTSASESNSYGIHVSGREKDTTNKYNGTLIINNSTIELDYLINKGNITLDNSTLTVKNGFSIGGRPAVETESGEDATATINLTNSSKLVVNNHNGMGLGYEAIGIMNVTEGSTFECTQSFLITAKGTLNVDGGSVIIAGTLTNLGVNTTFKDATVKINKLNNGAALFVEGENTIQIEDVSGSSFAIRAKDGVIFNDSYMPGTANETLRLLGSATFNGGFKCAYLQGAGASQGGIGGTVTIEDGTVIEVSYGVEFSNDYVLNGGSIELSGGNASGGIWGFVFQDANFEINTDISVDGGESYAPIHFTDAVATINSSITQVNSHGEPLYIGDASEVTLGSNALINTLSVHGAGKLILDVTGMTDGEYANVKCSASGFTGTLETVGNDILSAEIVDGKIVLVDISVAKIGDKLFASIQAAVDAAAAGDVILLTKDVVLTEGVVIAKDDSITLDLAGKTISMNDASGKTAYAIRNNGTLTVKDSVGDGTILFETSTPSMSNSYASNAISNYGTITIESGTIKNNGVGGACYALDNYAGSTATINGGKFMAVKSTVRIFNWTDGDASKATLTVNGGEIISDLGYAITFNMGNTPAVELNINGGTVTTNDPNYNLAVYIISKNDAKNVAIKVTDGTFNGYFALNGITSTTMADGNISIEGGKFDGVICYDEPAFGFVSGGSFVVKPEANVCAEGCAFAENADGSFGIVEAKVTLNGDGYSSFEEALEAANDGDTIALLDDVSFDEVLVLDKAITISANGKAITAAIKVSANVVIDNAVINGVAGNVAVITITGDAKLTVQDGKIVAAKAMSARSGSALSTDNQYILLAEGTNGASAYLDTELDYGDKNIFIGDANTITVSVKEAYKADLAARGFVTSEADVNGMVTISGSVPYYIGENGNWFFNGEDTGKKAIGTDGNNFTIGDDGYWYLNGVKTEYKAVAKDADQYTIGEDGYWYLNGSKTEFKALGTDGKNYTIGDDGYWYLNDVKTEHKAIGTDGDKVEIRDDGYWYINNVKTEYKAVGEPGQTPQFKIEDGNLKASFDGVVWEDLGPVVAAKPLFKIEDGVLKISYDNVNWEPLGTVAGEAGSKITIEKVGDYYYWHIDGVNTNVKAEGVDGTKVTLEKVDGVYYWHIDGVNSGVKAEGIDGAAGSKITLKPIDGVYYWHIDDVNSGVKAEGVDGTKVTLQQVDGVFYWFLNGVNSGVKAEGQDGSAPTISEDGFWVIGGVKTTYSAVGKDGKNYTIGEDGYWYCDGVKTEYRAIGVDGKTPTFKIDAGNLYVSYDNGESWTNLGRVVGEDGKTPYIGENGNWWIGDTDTEVPAQGQDGKAPFIGENGNWWIGDKDTGISATGNSDSDMKEIIMLCIGMAILCVITILVAVITRKSRSRWWILS